MYELFLFIGRQNSYRTLLRGNTAANRGYRDQLNSAILGKVTFQAIPRAIHAPGDQSISRVTDRFKRVLQRPLGQYIKNFYRLSAVTPRNLSKLSASNVFSISR